MHHVFFVITLISSLMIHSSFAADNKPLNCQYQFSDDPGQINKQTLVKWAENVAIAAFEFNYKNKELHFAALQDCFTTAGWKSFNDALTRSNNLEIINQEKLTVSATVAGQAEVTTDNSATWQITVPMTVNYENDNKFFKQRLATKLEIVVQNNDDGEKQFGITQLIATTS